MQRSFNVPETVGTFRKCHGSYESTTFTKKSLRTAIFRSWSSGGLAGDEESLAVSISLPGFSSARASGCRSGRRRRRGGGRRGRRGGRRRGRPRRHLEPATVVVHPVTVTSQRRDVAHIAPPEEIRRQFQRVRAPQAGSTLRAPAERVAPSRIRFHGRPSAPARLVDPVPAAAPSGRPPAAPSAPPSLVPASPAAAASSSTTALAPVAARRSSGSSGTTFDSHGARVTPPSSARRCLQLRQVRQDVQHAAWTRGSREAVAQR